MSSAQIEIQLIASIVAIACAIPGTSKVKHLSDNMLAGFGLLPNQENRNKMIQLINSL